MLPPCPAGDDESFWLERGLFPDWSQELAYRDVLAALALSGHAMACAS